MKKKIFGAALIAAMALAAGWNFNQSKNEVELSDLTLSNVEATAMCEVTKGDKVRLKCTGKETCSTTYLGHTLTCDGTKVAL